MRRVHFTGIGGVGMNGLAQLAALSSFSVSGSDRGCKPGAEPFKTLQKIGIRIVPQDGSGLSADTGQVVYSTAIESDNPDLIKAKELGIPLLHRSEFLKELIGNDELIAVAGTAGKTTTTGLLGWIFECLGKDPSVYNGAAVLNWKEDGSLGNIRKGNSSLWIIEADESDKSFLNFHPTHSIITNISKDHYELDELHRMFDRFESQTSGTTIRGHIRGQSLNYGILQNSRTDPSTAPLSTGADKDSDAGTYSFADLPLQMHGEHNQENACCAARLCLELGMDMDRVREAISRFKGIERRLEIIGRVDGITIIDDYAHNPAKIVAALTAVGERYRKVHAYWRPHGFTPLFQYTEDLVRVFKQVPAASLFILPVYYAGGTVERKTTSAGFVDQLKSAGIPARLMPDYATLKQELEQFALSGDAILGMGARDPELPLFAKRLVAEWKRP